MIQRDIGEGEIDEALANETDRWPSDDYPDDRLVICGTTRNGRRLKVVVEVADPNYVVTVADRDDER